jgi:hypothetical protein
MRDDRSVRESVEGVLDARLVQEARSEAVASLRRERGKLKYPKHPRTVTSPVRSGAFYPLVGNN